MNRTYYTFNTASDEERAERLTLCRNRRPHQWGAWRRGDWDGASIATDYQRRCAGCGKEQRGTGSAWGLDVTPTDYKNRV